MKKVDMPRKQYEAMIRQMVRIWRNSQEFPEGFAYKQLRSFLGDPDGTCCWPKCHNPSGSPKNSGDAFFCHSHCPLCG